MAFDTTRAASTAQASEAGHEFEPIYPDGSPLGAKITVRGPRSQAVRDHAARMYAKSTARELQAKKTGKPAEPLTLAQVDESLTDLAVAYTMGWSGMETAGQALPHSDDEARELYTAHPWLREQVINEAQDLGNFIKPACKTSTPTPAQSSA